MEFALPLYAVQRLADGTWLVRTQMGDPILPAVDVVAGGRSPLPLEAFPMSVAVSDGLMGYVASVIRQQLDEHEARHNPTKMALEMVAKLSPEVRMMALGLRS